MFPALGQLQGESWKLLRWIICEFQLSMTSLTTSLDGTDSVVE